MGLAGLLLNRQRVHVGAKGDGSRTGSCVEARHHAMSTDAPHHLPAPALEQACNQFGCRLFLVGKFGMAVDVTPGFAQKSTRSGEITEFAKTAQHAGHRTVLLDDGSFELIT